ncbi:MAG TPA: hypothetical protein VK175_08280 [Leadbetterella sp.]|nr:hypothetical protein [Leadbetterella sp.]
MNNFFEITSKLSFSLVIVSIFLPFMLVKCVDEKVATATGFELIKGEIEEVNNAGKFDPNNPFEDKKDKGQNSSLLNSEELKKESNPYIIATALLALLGLIISFLKVKRRKQTFGLISLFGVGLLIVFGLTIDGFILKISSEYQNTLSKSLKITLQEGFYLAVFGFLLNFIEPIYEVFQDQEFVND